MKYDISKSTAPQMPTLGKGTECIKILLSQTSKDMHEPLVPMLFPLLGAHVSGAEFQYPDHSWKELCGQMANLVAESGGNKGQLSHLVEAVCRDFRRHDELLYFPVSMPGTAVKHLMTTIRRCDMLWDELQAMGYNNRRKTFTPREVRAIVEWLGAP